jgi:hypothetical protein
VPVLQVGVLRVLLVLVLVLVRVPALVLRMAAGSGGAARACPSASCPPRRSGRPGRSPRR